MTAAVAAVAILAVLAAAALAVRLYLLEREVNGRVRREAEAFRREDLLAARAELQDSARREAAIALGEWKARYAVALRQDAVQRSQAVTAGKVWEQLVPFLPGFAFNPKDARFLGSPIDLVVFDGLDEGDVRRVVLVEVKTGGSALSARERQVRDAVQSGRVEWCELRLGDPGEAPR